MNGSGEESGRDEDEDEAGNTEEAGHVDAQSATEDPVAQGDATATPRTAPRPVTSGVVEPWNAASMKTAVSSPSRSTARNAMATRAHAEPVIKACAASSSSVRLELARVPAHPDDHVGDAGHGHESQDPLHDLALLEGQRLPNEVQANGCRRADGHGQQDAKPHVSKRACLAPLSKERGNDPDDQRCFQAFAQADDERWQQALSPLKLRVGSIPTLEVWNSRVRHL